jgi:hypothetical protein
MKKPAKSRLIYVRPEHQAIWKAAEKFSKISELSLSTIVALALDQFLTRRTKEIPK